MDKPICPNISIFSLEGESQSPSCVNKNTLTEVESEKTLTEGESQPPSKSHTHTDTKRQPSSIGLQFLNAFSSLDKENQLSDILISEGITCPKVRNRERSNRQTKKWERSHQLTPEPPPAATENELKSYPQSWLILAAIAVVNTILVLNLEHFDTAISAHFLVCYTSVLSFIVGTSFVIYWQYSCNSSSVMRESFLPLSIE